MEGNALVGFSQSETEQHLLTVLEMINEWLKFAEAKNAGLVALAGLSLTGLLSFVAQIETFGVWAAALLICGATCWLVSLMLSTFSFMPERKTVPPKGELKDLVEDTDNLFYFGHLASFSSETLLIALGVEQEAEGPRARFERNLAHQVITNSRITVNKLDLFENATRLWVAGTLVVVAGIVVVLVEG